MENHVTHKTSENSIDLYHLTNGHPMMCGWPNRFLVIAIGLERDKNETFSNIYDLPEDRKMTTLTVENA